MQSSFWGVGEDGSNKNTRWKHEEDMQICLRSHSIDRNHSFILTESEKRMQIANRSEW